MCVRKLFWREQWSWWTYFFNYQLAEALFEYGIANYQKVFDMLGPNFDAIDYKVPC